MRSVLEVVVSVDACRSPYVLVGREEDKERNLKGGKLCFRVDRVGACFRKGLGSGDASGRGRERGRWAWQAESRWYGQWTIGTSSVHVVR